jgi:RimJ/RimL family protein N-acetyltransferase
MVARLPGQAFALSSPHVSCVYCITAASSMLKIIFAFLPCAPLRKSRRGRKVARAPNTRYLAKRTPAASLMIETSRLILRPWEDSDIAEFIRVTNTPAVMEFLGGVQTPEAMRESCMRAFASQEKNGFSFWIVERQRDLALLGFCGLKVGSAGPITGEIEIGWRLREDAWGQGYAREAAIATLEWAWRNLACSRVVAVTVRANTRSWGLMERLGMQRRRDMDFDHPDIPEGSPIRAHITYEIGRPTCAEP